MAPIAVETIVVDTPLQGATVVASGTVHRQREAAIGFRVGGVLAGLSFEAGDRVTRGQVIASLDETPFRIRATQAAATLERAQRDVRRYQALAEQGFVSIKQIEDLRTEVAQAKASYDAAEFDRRSARLTAPASGVVLSRSAQVGEVLQPGQAIMVLADDSSGFVLRAPVADRDAARIKLSAAVQIEIDGLPGQRLQGQIIRMGQLADAHSGAVLAEISTPSVPGLRSGMVGRARIGVERPAQKGADHARVPMEAVLEADGTRAVVFRVDRTGVARLTVVPFAGFDGDAVLLRGLRPGTRLITSGAGVINDGDRVIATASAVEEP